MPDGSRAGEAQALRDDKAKQPGSGEAARWAAVTGIVVPGQIDVSTGSSFTWKA
jgi:hypothetical protein